MSRNIGEINEIIVRNLSLSEEDQNRLRELISERRSTPGDEKYAALGLYSSRFANLQYWQLLCERWDVTISDLEGNNPSKSRIVAEDRWHIIRELVRYWITANGEEHRKVVRWLHERYNLPKEAIISNSHYIMYHAVMQKSIEVAKWLMDNFDISLGDSFAHLEPMRTMLLVCYPESSVESWIAETREELEKNIAEIEKSLKIA